MSKVIVFGSLNMDVSIDCEVMPRAGETVHGSGLLLNPGGKGGNQAVAAAKMGADVRMVAALGDDAFGRSLRESLERAGVDCGAVVTDGTHATGTAVILRSHGDNRIVVEPGANMLLCGEDVERVLDDVAEPGDILLMQFECDLDAVARAATYAHRKGLVVAVNPAPVHDVPEGFWNSVDILCLNETECERITGILPTGEDEVERALSACAELGVATTVLTLGARGSVGAGPDGVVRMGSLAVDAIDTTGAGDTYLGALVASLAEGAGLSASMRLASAAAALATTGLGAQQSIPTRADAERSLEGVRKG